MSRKSWAYAQFEAISQVAQEYDNDVIMVGGYQWNASFPGLPGIDLVEQLGARRVLDYSSIDELWYAGAALGSALVGVRSINWHDQYMANAYPFELISQHAAKLHHMTGGQAQIPAVFVTAISNQAPGMAGQHSDYESDSWYAHVAGLKTVIPSTVYDAKGLMVSALRDDDPVMYFNYGAFRGMVDDVPDEPYEVQIGKAAVRREGGDITLVGSGASMRDVNGAAEQLSSDGVEAEVIDLVTLHPLDTETLVRSVEKTGNLVAVDQSKYTLGPAAEVVARVAEGVPGARVRRLAWPDAPPPGAPEMFEWMKPNAERVAQAARMLLDA